MKSYGLNLKGELVVEKVTTLPTWTVDDIGRIIYVTGTEDVYIGTSSSFKGLGDIPSGETILFDKNTAVAGYTLQTDIDDQLVYITKGSAAGGETGGTVYTGSTWTTPSHTLTTDEIPSHNHQITGRMPRSGFSVEHHQYNSRLPIQTYDTNPYTSSVGGGQAHNHGDTWRPRGRNYTRQTRD